MMETSNNDTLLELTKSMRILSICMREMLTVKETALFLGKSEDSIRKMMQNNDIPYYVARQHAYFSRSELELWLKQRGRKVPTALELDQQANKVVSKLKKRI